MALGDQEQEAEVRSFLIALGVLPIAALTPAMLLLTAGATRSAEAGAALIIAVPVYLTMLAIAVFIATFEPGPESLLLKRAQNRKTRAVDRAETLRGLASVNQPCRSCGRHTLVCVVIPVALVGTLEWDPRRHHDPCPSTSSCKWLRGGRILGLTGSPRKPDATPLEGLLVSSSRATHGSGTVVLLSFWLPRASEFSPS